MIRLDAVATTKIAMRRLSSYYAGQVAARYDQVRENGEVWRLEREAVVPFLTHHVKPGSTVLDLAAGTGRWLDVYAARNARAILIDVSKDMLRVAETKALSLALPVETRKADMFQLLSLPHADCFVATRFFNWIPLDRVRHVLRLASDSGSTSSRFVFTVRCISRRSGPLTRFWSRLRVMKRNMKVRLGLRQKSIYFLHGEQAVDHMLATSDLEVLGEATIRPMRGEIYKVVCVSLAKARGA
jgi:SAM-dependent methyltransferase